MKWNGYICKAHSLLSPRQTQHICSTRVVISCHCQILGNFSLPFIFLNFDCLVDNWVSVHLSRLLFFSSDKVFVQDLWVLLVKVSWKEIKIDSEKWVFVLQDCMNWGWWILVVDRIKMESLTIRSLNLSGYKVLSFLVFSP